MATNKHQIRNDENERMAFRMPGKLATTKDVTTKRAALGELGNRSFMRPTNDSKVATRNFIDDKTKMTLRSRVVGEKPAVEIKQITRNNSTKTTARSAVLTNIQTRKAVTVKSGDLPTVQKVIVKEEPKDSILKREDSNLSQKSLSRLKAALARDRSKKVVSSACPIFKTKIEIKAEVPTLIPVPGIKVEPPSVNQNNVTSDNVGPSVHIDNIDIRDANNPILVSEYVNDIYEYLRQLEIEQPVERNFLEGQHVTPKMRSVLIDWINEVHLQFHLIPETFQMTVGIIDRYLQIEKGTTRDYLQLVGVTALFIASKYEELYPPSMDDFVYITDNTYTKKEILAMEMKIMRTIDYNLSRPLPIQFLRRCSKAAEATDCHHGMAKYFLELSSTDYAMAAVPPSKLAAASLLLSLRLSNRNPSRKDVDLWTATLEHYSAYNVKALRPIVKQIAEIVKAAPTSKLQSVYHKHSSSKFNGISLSSELKGSNLDKIINEKIAE